MIEFGPFFTDGLLYVPSAWRVLSSFVRTLHTLKAIDKATYEPLYDFINGYDGYYDLDDSWDNDFYDENDEILNDLLDKK